MENVIEYGGVLIESRFLLEEGDGDILVYPNGSFIYGVFT